jgi:hypothetical protein
MIAKLDCTHTHTQLIVFDIILQSRLVFHLLLRGSVSVKISLIFLAKTVEVLGLLVAHTWQSKIWVQRTRSRKPGKHI